MWIITTVCSITPFFFRKLLKEPKIQGSQPIGDDRIVNWIAQAVRRDRDPIRH